MIFGQHNNCRREEDEVVCLDCCRRFGINDEVYPPCVNVTRPHIRRISRMSSPEKLTKEVCDELLLKRQIEGYYELTTVHGLESYCLTAIEAQVWRIRNRGGVAKWITE